jgi:hypothetical protein
MDGAQAGDRNRTIAPGAYGAMSRKAWGSGDEVFGASLDEAAPSADLGGSSNYSNGNFED